MSPDGQQPVKQAGADDADQEVPGLILLLFGVVTSAITAGYVFFSDFLNWLLGLTEEFPYYFVAIAALALIWARAVPRTIRHVGILAAVAAAAGIVGMVVSAPFLLLAQSMFAEDSDHALQWTIILPGLITASGVIYFICTWSLRRFAVPCRPSPHRTTPRKVK